MQLRNDTNSYGWIAVVFHWVLAVAILGLFALGFWMVELDYYSSWYHDAPEIHKSMGVIVVFLMLLRLLWTLANPQPISLVSRLETLVAHLVHKLLYLLVVLLGVSGYLISTAEDQPIRVFDWFEVPVIFTAFEGQADIAGEVHMLIAYLLIGLVVLHILGALKHHFFDKDDTFKRMLKPGGKHNLDE